MTDPDRYRVVQWATGNIGSHSLRAIIAHPNLDLVGLYVYSEDKAGRDAGELCGVAPTGVLATRDIGEILALQPDCVVYMADRVDVDALCQLLEAGVNVVSTRSEFHNPAHLDPETRRRIETACAAGRLLAPQHWLEPRVHHRGPATRARLAAAPARSSVD